MELGHKTAWEIHLPLLVMTFNYLKRFHMGPLQCWMWWAINACSQPECFINRHTQVSKVVLMRKRVTTVRSEVRIINVIIFNINMYKKNCTIKIYNARYEVTIVRYKVTFMKKSQRYEIWSHNCKMRSHSCNKVPILRSKSCNCEIWSKNDNTTALPNIRLQRKIS